MGAGDIIIRDAVVGDAEALAAYANALGAESLDTIPFRGPKTVEEERTFIETAAASDRGLILVAEHADRIVGLLDVKVGSRCAERHAGVFGMSVAGDWRGRGVGRRLLTTAIDRVRAWDGFCRLELEVVPWNTAGLALYDSLGFQFEGRKKKAVDLRGSPEDSIIMALVW